MVPSEWLQQASRFHQTMQHIAASTRSWSKDQVKKVVATAEIEQQQRTGRAATATDWKSSCSNGLEEQQLIWGTERQIGDGRPSQRERYVLQIWRKRKKRERHIGDGRPSQREICAVDMEKEEEESDNEKGELRSGTLGAVDKEKRGKEMFEICSRVCSLV